MPPKDFPVTKYLLVNASDFFKAALAQEWVEGQTRTVKLPDDDAESFSGYSLPSAFKMFILGDKLLDIAFKDAMTDAVLAVMLKQRGGNTYMSPKRFAISLLYKKETPGHMRDLIVHRWACVNNWQDIITTEWSPGFLLDFCNVLAAEQPQESTLEAAIRCAFHEHTPGNENCYRTKR
ncbi:hypothetical protein TI39_contig802g00002 [Zymoseptoria brevis]|uniref:BTB domain-containing protein n=1 Tax=Zymoseptoria brevis TaxID=1047168 RepID=A0A0F4GJ09_9PEZI|nr:hypothetical protein TI39_contig802g00002 [Zymoseptoria brevis]